MTACLPSLMPSGRDEHSTRGVLRLPEFRALAAAGLVSATGDQLARVALSVLVYERTASPLLTALTYALTFLPAVVGGPLLAGLADRLPRRRLMVGGNLVQGLLVAVMAIPGTPLGGLLALLVAVNILAAPVSAARSALIPDVAGGGYVAALVVDRNLQQTAQIAGFAGSGLLLLVFSPGQALLIDAGSFLASAVLLRFGVGHRPPAVTADASSDSTRVTTGWRARPRRAVQDARLGMQTIRERRSVRRAVLLTWLVAGFAIVPEGLAVPYARQLHGGTVLAALILAANPAGNVLSAVWAGRWSRGQPARLLPRLAQLAVAPLAVCAFDPPAPVVLTLLVASGVGMTVSLLARTIFVAHVPPEVRGRAFGVAGTGIFIAQGLAVIVSGAAASIYAPSTVTGAAGLIGSAAAATLLGLTRARAATPAGAESS
jgi:MFS family permease